MSRAYKVVDVFTSTPLKGNPVAVILDASGLSTSDMQAIASWTNLSETTFLCPPTNPEADYLLRIFTPRQELPFAGHPTLGSAHAALEAGRATPRDGRLVQECAKGLVNLRVEGEGSDRTITLSLPEAKVTPLSDADGDELESILGGKIDHMAWPVIVDVGPRWIVARLHSAAEVIALRPDFARQEKFDERLGAIGITVFGEHEKGGEVDIEVRSFAPADGVPEDPVCGSGNGSVAVFRHLKRLLPAGGGSDVAAQGQCLGRAGRIQHRVDKDGKVEIGGKCVTTAEGTLNTGN